MGKDELLDKLRKQNYPINIVNAFSKVARDDFVPEHLAGYAYEDMALPVLDGSTLSQPSVVAFMLKLLDLKQGQKILEIGSGSGYVLALMSEIIKEGKIYGIELNKELSIKSKKYLANDSNIEIFSRNGFNGLKEFEPFDRILISASADSIPSHLLHQLKEEGILVTPVGQSIFQIRKGKERIEEKEYPGFAFIKLKKD